MAQVARLNIDLVARTAKLTAGLQKGVSQITGFQRKVMGLAKGLAAIFAARQIMRLGRSVSDFVKSGLDQVDTLAKVSDKLGLTVNDLIVLREASRRYSGMEAKAMDTALQRFTRRLAEAASGTGEAQKAIKELGLNAKELIDLGTEKAFERVADAIAKVQKPADRLRLSFKFFDAEGAALATTMAQGSIAIARIREELNRLGLNLTQIDVKSVEALKDGFSKVSLILEQIRMKLASQLAPSIAVIGQHLLAWASHGAKFKAIIDSIINGVNIGLAAAYYLMAKIEFSARGWQATMLEIQRAFAQMVGDTQKEKRLADEIQRVIGRLSELASTNWAQKFFDDLQKFKDELEKVTDRQNAAAAGLAGAGESPAALQRGAAGIQHIISMTGAREMVKMVAEQKKAVAEAKKTAGHTKEIRDGIKAWMDVGIMAF